MAPKATQDTRQIGLSSPLGKDVLLLRSVTAHEELGRLFQFDLDVLSEDAELDLQGLLGQSVTIRLDVSADDRRYYNGIVSQFRQVGGTERFAAYVITLRPWLWFLTQSQDCRIFQKMRAPDIIEKVFRDRGFTDFEVNLSATYREREYCVQYRESDFDFVSRLMEHEGIYYFFKHEDGKHTLVLADSSSAHKPVPNYDEVPYYPRTEKLIRERDHVFDWFISHQVRSKSYVLNDFDFENPKVSLLVPEDTPVQPTNVQPDLEVYDYPGGYTVKDDGKNYVKRRASEAAAQCEFVHGEGNARGLATGFVFSLTGYPRADQNREYLVVSTTQQFHSDSYEDSKGSSSFYCSFDAIDNKTTYRTPRTTPKPIVRGPQTAIVVGPSGDEIHTDEYGRIKVQFHWDREGEANEQSSCWIRVAQTWAGNAWGSIRIPRVGQEVVVDFLEGDPDRPLVVGSVYNADCMPPYKLPDNQTQSGVKSRTSKDGHTEAFNELRFEDKEGSEEIYFHAEKDFKRVVENDDTLSVGMEKQDPGNQTIEIYNDRTTTLEQGSDTLEIRKGDSKTTLGEGNFDLQVQSGDYGLKIDSGRGTITAAQAIELKVGSSSIKLEPAKITLKSVEIVVKGDAKVVVDGAMSEVKGSAMVTIKGGIVKIN